MRNQKSKSAFTLKPETLGLAVKGPTLNVSDEEKKVLWYRHVGGNSQLLMNFSQARDRRALSSE